MDNFLKRTGESVCFFIINLGLVFLFGCSGEPEKTQKAPPDFLIPKDSMELILFDMHLLEGYGNQNPDKLSGPEGIFAPGYQHIYNKYQISEKRFKQSYEHYLKQPDELQVMYDNVLEELTKEQAKLRGTGKGKE